MFLLHCSYMNSRLHAATEPRKRILKCIYLNGNQIKTTLILIIRENAEYQIRYQST